MKRSRFRNRLTQRQMMAPARVHNYAQSLQTRLRSLRQENGCVMTFEPSSPAKRQWKPEHSQDLTGETTK